VISSDGEQPEHEMNEASAIKPIWITYRQAQILTGLSRGTLSKIASAGLVPRSKHGSAARLHLPSLERYMWRNAEQAEPPQAQGPTD
jgi:hypothetical protein